MTHTIVVGAGIIGASIAWRLAQQGVRVTVFERAQPGGEASSAAGGILGPQKESDAPGPFLELGLRSRALYRAFVDEVESASGIACALSDHGILQAAFDAAGAEKLAEKAAWQRRLDLRVELLDSSAARQLEPSLSEAAVAALHYPDDRHVDCQRLTRALAVAARRAGVVFRTGHVARVARQGDRAVGVEVDGERVESDSVVVAAGAASGLVGDCGLTPAHLRPARGQMVALRPQGPLFDRVLFSDRGYLVPRRDGRVLAGSTFELVGFDKRVTADGMAKVLGMALELCPELKEAEIEATWAGLRPLSVDRVPVLGPGPVTGLFLATGHFRNGILFAPLTALAVSDWVQGRAPLVDLTPFDPRRLVA